MAKEKRFIWLDVETTGLSPQNNLLLEVAWWTTRSPHPLDLGEYSSEELVVHHDGETLGRHLSSVTWKMHGASGLLAAVIESANSLSRVESRLSSVLTGVYQWHLAGNSVHFDRGFLNQHMPAAASRLHHRILDVSSIGLAAESMGWAAEKKPPAHRAMDDVKASIAQYTEQLDWISRRGGLGAMPAAIAEVSL